MSRMDSRKPRPIRPQISKSTPGSRSNSPGAPSRRIQKLNSYLSKMASNSTDNLSRLTEAMSKPAAPVEPIRTTSIRRWDGSRRTTTNWDSIRRVSQDLQVTWSLGWSLTDARTLNSGSPTAIVWCTSMPRVSLEEVLLYVFRLRLLSRAIADPCSNTTVPKPMSKVPLQHQTFHRHRMRTILMIYRHRQSTNSSSQHLLA